MKRLAGSTVRVGGEVTVTGDKSISHRALLVAALAHGVSRLRGLNSGRDVAATCAALRAFGVAVVEHDPNGEVEVEGRGWDGLGEAEGVIDAGNSGTTARCLLAVCSGLEHHSVITGDASLRARPMLRAVAPLRQMGARIDGRRHGERLPLAVRGGALVGLEHELRVASAQVKTALLLAGLRAQGTTTVVEPGPSRDHTELMLEAAGVPLRRGPGRVSVEGGHVLGADDRVIPGDISSALFLIVAATLLPGSDLLVRDVGLNPTRTAALEVLTRMGADLTIEVEGLEHGEPVGSVRARHATLRATDVGGDEIPRLIDELPVLAIAAARAEGTTLVTDAAELRVKESDRIAALERGLSTLGCEVETRPDGMAITGPCELSGGHVESFGDHRIAMAFAVGGLVARDRVRVRGWNCVDTSWPEFLDVLAHAQRQKR